MEKSGLSKKNKIDNKNGKTKDKIFDGEKMIKCKICNRDMALCKYCLCKCNHTCYSHQSKDTKCSLCKCKKFEKGLKEK